MPKIVIASDSFKGSLSSAEVAESIARGLKTVLQDCELLKISVADGGEGTVDALRESLGGHSVSCKAHDPLMREIEAEYTILADKRTAVIEMASASGLTLLSTEERNPMKTSTFGTGEMIADALSKGCDRFLVGIGGSATNDGGMGVFSALGYRFLDRDGRQLPPCGESLAKVAGIDCSRVNPRLQEAVFTVACDVDTPFCGREGAAYIFAPQKGASSEEVEILDCGLENFASVISASLGRDISSVPGSGAAGGLGGAFLAFSNSSLKKGIDMVLDAIDFDSMIEGADAVITGEGRIDSQTFKGKTPFGVMCRARQKGIPLYAIGGCAELDGVSGISRFSSDGEHFSSDGGHLSSDGGHLSSNGGHLSSNGGYDRYYGRGFDCIVPAVSGEYDSELAMRKDIAEMNVAAAAAFLAKEILGNPQ